MDGPEIHRPTNFVAVSGKMMKQLGNGDANSLGPIKKSAFDSTRPHCCMICDEQLVHNQFFPIPSKQSEQRRWAIAFFPADKAEFEYLIDRCRVAIDVPTVCFRHFEPSDIVSSNIGHHLKMHALPQPWNGERKCVSSIYDRRRKCIVCMGVKLNTEVFPYPQSTPKCLEWSLALCNGNKKQGKQLSDKVERSKQPVICSDHFPSGSITEKGELKPDATPGYVQTLPGSNVMNILAAAKIELDDAIADFVKSGVAKEELDKCFTTSVPRKPFPEDESINPSSIRRHAPSSLGEIRPSTPTSTHKVTQTNPKPSTEEKPLTERSNVAPQQRLFDPPQEDNKLFSNALSADNVKEEHGDWVPVPCSNSNAQKTAKKRPVGRPPKRTQRFRTERTTVNTPSTSVSKFGRSIKKKSPIEIEEAPIRRSTRNKATPTPEENESDESEEENSSDDENEESTAEEDEDDSEEITRKLRRKGLVKLPEMTKCGRTVKPPKENTVSSADAVRIPKRKRAGRPGRPLKTENREYTRFLNMQKKQEKQVREMQEQWEKRKQEIEELAKQQAAAVMEEEQEEMNKEASMEDGEQQEETMDYNGGDEDMKDFTREASTESNELVDGSRSPSMEEYVTSGNIRRISEPRPRKKYRVKWTYQPQEKTKSGRNIKMKVFEEEDRQERGGLKKRGPKPRKRTIEEMEQLKERLFPDNYPMSNESLNYISSSGFAPKPRRQSLGKFCHAPKQMTESEKLLLVEKLGISLDGCERSNPTAQPSTSTKTGQSSTTARVPWPELPAVTYRKKTKCKDYTLSADKLLCYICHKWIEDTAYGLKEHSREHALDTLRCPVDSCSFTATTRSRISYHTSNIHRNWGLAIDMAEESREMAAVLNSIIRKCFPILKERVAPEEGTTCAICNSVVEPEFRALHSHACTHLPSRPYCCSNCHKSEFYNEEQVEEHIEATKCGGEVTCNMDTGISTVVDKLFKRAFPEYSHLVEKDTDVAPTQDLSTILGQQPLRKQRERVCNLDQGSRDQIQFNILVYRAFDHDHQYL